MFDSLAAFVVRRPWWLIGSWLVAAVLLVSLALSLDDITNSDQSKFQGRRAGPAAVSASA